MSAQKKVSRYILCAPPWPAYMTREMSFHPCPTLVHSTLWKSIPFWIPQDTSSGFGEKVVGSHCGLSWYKESSGSLSWFWHLLRHWSWSRRLLWIQLRCHIWGELIEGKHFKTNVSLIWSQKCVHKNLGEHVLQQVQKAFDEERRLHSLWSSPVT